jgi:hypothetical protein
MVQASSSHEARSSAKSLLASCALLGIVIAPFSVLVATVCRRELSGASLFVAAVAGGVCWFAASTALTATWLGNRFQAPVQGMLLGMLFRMGVPLAAVVGLPQAGGVFAANGLAVTILGVYLAALLTETLLAVRMIAPLSAAKANPA